jgi:hypothetical protein
VEPPGSNTFHRPPPIPRNTVEENVSVDVQMKTARYNLHVTPPGSSTSPRPPPIPAKTVAKNIREDVQMPTGRFNLSRMPPGSITSPTAPTIPPKTQVDEHIYHELDMHTADHILRPFAAKAEADELYEVYELTLPDKNSDHFK